MLAGSGSGRIDAALALLCGLAAFALYVRTLAPGVLGGDSGEFQVAAWIGGLVHPTGYPLYLLLGYAWVHLLPFGSVALRLNLLSAVFAGVAVGLVYLLALELLRLVVTPDSEQERPADWLRAPALLTAVIFAVTPTFWSQAVIAEVYALHAALIAGMFLAFVRWAAHPAVRRRALYVAALLFGLGLVHHRTTILLAPVILLRLAWRWPRPVNWRAIGGTALRALPLVLAPLLLYAYVPLRAAATPYLHPTLAPGQTLDLYDPTVAGFLRYVTGQTFEGAFRTPAGALAQAPAAARLLLAELGWPGLALGLLGLAALIWKRRWALLALSGLQLLILAGFNLFYGIGDIFVYYIPVYMIWCLWIGMGLAALAELLQRAVPWAASPPREQINNESVAQGKALRNRLGSVALVTLIGVLLAGWLGVRNFGRVDQSGATQWASGWQAILDQPLPQDAVLVTNDRDEMVPLYYYQDVEGRAAGLTGLFPLIAPGPAWSDVGRVTNQALATGRPVYLIKPMPGLDVKYRLAPEGPVVRVLGPIAGRPQRAARVDYGATLRLIGYDVARTGDRATVTLYWQPLAPLDADYTTYVHLLDADGAVIGQEDHRPGGLYYPSHLWQVGDVLADAHTFAVQPGTHPAPYRIEAGVYTNAGGLQHLGQPQIIGVLQTGF